MKETEGLLVKSKPTGAEGSPPMSAEEISGLVRGFRPGELSESLLRVLRTADWLIETLKAYYTCDEFCEDCTSKLRHWLREELDKLGVDVDKLCYSPETFGPR